MESLTVPSRSRSTSRSSSPASSAPVSLSPTPASTPPASCPPSPFSPPTSVSRDPSPSPRLTSDSLLPPAPSVSLSLSPDSSPPPLPASASQSPDSPPVSPLLSVEEDPSPPPQPISDSLLPPEPFISISLPQDPSPLLRPDSAPQSPVSPPLSPSLSVEEDPSPSPQPISDSLHPPAPSASILLPQDSSPPPRSASASQSPVLPPHSVVEDPSSPPHSALSPPSSPPSGSPLRLRSNSALISPPSSTSRAQPSPPSLSRPPSLPASQSSSTTPSIDVPPIPTDSSTQIADSPQIFDPRRKPFVQKSSAAALEWQRQKDEGANNAAIDKLMGLVGLEEVKQQVLAIKAKVETCKRQETDLQKERFNIVFQGNPGTGKTTVARIYAEFLYSMGVLKSKMVKETSGAKLAYKGPAGIKRIIRKIVDRAEGGVLFVDEAYQLTAPYASVGGRQVLDIILTEMENNIGKLVVIFVGYNKEMESFFEHNPGLASRVPYTLQFTDFEDVELWNILSDNIGKKYGGQMKIEGGLDGLYMRVAIRRLARGRGIRGFGNARSVDNLLARISERQAKRLTKQSKDGLNPDYFLFIKEDLIGPDPSEAASSSAAWAELQELIGLDAVKASAKGMIDMIETNYRRELAERNPLNFSLNRVFFGSPGTGKTTVAKLYGQIMADLGLLSNGEVVVKNPSDFIGKCLGKSEAQTRAILGATLGKVLIIDEAYMLNSGGPEKQNDAYKTAVIDTLVAEVQSVPGDDRCILLLGYEDKLKEMFQNVNPGLSRRFAIDDPFRFEDFNLPQLEKILELKMRQQDLTATEQAKVVALEVLDRARMRPNYSNGGEVDTCLAKAKFNYQTRQSTKPVSEREFDAVLEPLDFDPNFDRNATALSNCRKRLENMVSNDIIEKLEDIQALSLGAKSHGLDPREHVPTKFVFKGPPGTGKTTTARNMGSVYYDMGFLSTDEVIECSASDLIGQFVGHTGPKTKVQLEKALGKVLFIDEAYRLAEGQYATEAVNELIYLLTTPRYEGKMIVILAGYTLDMNNLMTTRPGLSGLFPEEIVFENIKPHDCMILLDRELSQKQINAPYLKDTSNPDYLNLFRLVKMLSLFPSWSNARDIKTLAKQMTASAFREMHRTRTTAVRPIVFPGKEVPLPAEQAVLCIKRMIATQYDRCSNKEGKSGKFSPMAVNHAASQPMQCAQDSAHEQHYDTVTQTSKASAHCTPHHTESASDVIAEMDAPPPSAPLMSGPATKQQVDENQEKERRAQEKLRQMGVCPQGYVWNKVAGGYQCEGGSHSVTDAELDL